MTTLAPETVVTTLASDLATNSTASMSSSDIVANSSSAPGQNVTPTVPVHDANATETTPSSSGSSAGSSMGNLTTTNAPANMAGHDVTTTMTNSANASDQA